MSKKGKSSNDYLKTLEKVKKQYQEYLEVSKIYELPTFEQEKTREHQPPSPEHPLTTNSFRIK